MGIESLISGVTNKFYNSNAVKALSGVDYLSTAYGQDFIPEYTNLEGQKNIKQKLLFQIFLNQKQCFLFIFH